MESQEQWITAMRAGGRGNMDLGTPVDMYLPFTMKAGLFTPLDMSKLPNMERVFPEFRGLPNLMHEGKTYAVPFTFGSQPIMYNANVITEPPGSWWELFNPKYKGKAAIVEDSLGVFMIFSLMANGTKTPWNNTAEMVQKAVDLLIKFKKEQALTICASYGDLGALLGNGEVVIAAGWEPVSTMTGENSQPIKWSYPKEGTTNFVDTYAIFAGAPHVELDHAILNHVMSAEAQAAVAEKNATAVTNMDAVPLLSDKAKRLYPYDDIAGFFKKVGGHYQTPPLEGGGEFQTLDQVLKGWEQFLKA
jgi:spermidine/putrescine-binding protein